MVLTGERGLINGVSLRAFCGFLWVYSPSRGFHKWACIGFGEGVWLDVHCCGAAGRKIPFLCDSIEGLCVCDSCKHCAWNSTPPMISPKLLFEGKRWAMSHLS